MAQEQQDEKGFVDGREITLKEVELLENQHNDQVIDKIIFHQTDGNKITWKPKITKQNYEGGFKITKTVPMEKDFLPKKLIELAGICTEQGKCKVNAFYNYWITEKDGQNVTYRFIVSEKTLEKWQIIKEEVKEESIKDTP